MGSWEIGKKEIGFVVGLAVLAAFLNLCSGSKKDESNPALEKLAQEAVKDRIEPTLRFAALNPDTATGSWSAIKGAVGYTCSGECYTVYYRVDVMPTTEKKRMEFEWVYDTASANVVPANTESRTMFVTK